MLRCDQCDFSTARLTALVSHQQRRHGAPPAQRPRGRSKPIFRGEIEVKLKCPFCDKQFGGVVWWQNHATTCSDRQKFEARFGRRLMVPPAPAMRPYFFRDGKMLCFWVSTAASEAEAEQEWRAALEEALRAGRKRAPQHSAEVRAALVEAGYLRPA